MVQNCCVPNCNSKNKAKNLSFHEFPSRTDMCEQWTRAINRIESDGSLWIPDECSVVCSRHFRPEDYTQYSHNKILRRDVMPTIFPNHTCKVYEESCDSDTDVDLNSLIARYNEYKRNGKLQKFADRSRKTVSTKKIKLRKMSPPCSPEAIQAEIVPHKPFLATPRKRSPIAIRSNGSPLTSSNLFSKIVHTVKDKAPDIKCKKNNPSVPKSSRSFSSYKIIRGKPYRTMPLMRNDQRSVGTQTWINMKGLESDMPRFVDLQAKLRMAKKKLAKLKQENLRKKDEFEQLVKQDEKLW